MDPVKSALNLLRRLPPEEIENNFQLIGVLREDIADELIQQLDFPLKVGYDSVEKKAFIRSDFNSCGDSYRSPWSNQYFPPCEDVMYPTPRLRELEITANYLFDKYRELYYGRGVSSVYLWENGNHICGCFLILNEVTESSKDITGSWHALHLIEIIPEEDTKSAEYRLTSSIQLFLTVKNASIGEATQNGSLTRQSSSKMEYKTEEDHIANVGQMIEQMENYIRSNLDALYMSRNQDTVDSIRILHPMDVPKRSMLAELSSQLRPRVE